MNILAMTRERRIAFNILKFFEYMCVYIKGEYIFEFFTSAFASFAANFTTGENDGRRVSDNITTSSLNLLILGSKVWCISDNDTHHSAEERGVYCAKCKVVCWRRVQVSLRRLVE